MTPRASSCGFSVTPFMPFCLGVCANLIVVEAALHLRVVRDAMPVPEPYYIVGVEDQGRCLERLLEDKGKVDILFIGSSVVGCGVDAKMLESQLDRETGEQWVVFNAWGSGLNPDPARLYFERFWLGRCRPRVVVQGIRYAEVNARQSASQYEKFRRGKFEPLWLRDEFSARIQLAALERIRLLYYSGFVPEYLRDLRLPLNAPRGPALDERGGPIIQEPADVERPLLPTNDVTYVGTAVEVRLREGLAGVDRVARICRERKMLYIVVNIPEHSARYMGAEQGDSIYVSYLAVVTQWAQSKGVPFIDVTDGRCDAYGGQYYTYDYFHLNRAGRERFTTQMGERLVSLLRDRKGPPETKPASMVNKKP